MLVQFLIDKWDCIEILQFLLQLLFLQELVTFTKSFKWFARKYTLKQTLFSKKICGAILEGEKLRIRPSNLGPKN